jgi:hypothetical protein
MSREVEITGIHMTATVPESIQISLGKLTNGSAGLTSTNAKIDSTSKRLTEVVPPDDDEYWNNSIDISEYYQFGHLTPSTSTDGLNVYWTGDATGNGKTLKGHKVGADGVMIDGSGTTANFVRANAANNALTGGHTAAMSLVDNRAKTPTTLTGSGSDPYEAGANYDSSGCYIDVPVWIRTSSNSDEELAVIATITAGSNAYTQSGASAKTDQIFNAARVSILEGNNTDVKSTRTDGGTQGVIMNASGSYYRNGSGSNYSTGAFGSIASVSGDGSGTGTWGNVTVIEQGNTAGTDGKSTTGSTVMKATAAAEGTTWGAARPYTIRIWLEGEDVNCWNATAGQDWNISLRFVVKGS